MTESLMTQEEYKKVFRNLTAAEQNQRIRDEILEVIDAVEEVMYEVRYLVTFLELTELKSQPFQNIQHDFFTAWERLMDELMNIIRRSDSKPNLNSEDKNTKGIDGATLSR